jgi:DNA anti-recombination protein RmuC
MKDWYNFQNSENNQIKQKQMQLKFFWQLKIILMLLVKKDYSKLLNINSPDYIFIFMPHEFAIFHAQKYDSSIACNMLNKNKLL